MERFSDVIYAHEDAVRSVAYSPCGRFLLSGSNDCKVRVWDTKKMRSVGEHCDHCDHHRQAVRCVRFAPNGEGWASMGRNGEFYFYHKQGGRVSNSFGCLVPNFEFTRDGRNIVTSVGSGRVILWNLAARTTTPLQKHTSDVTVIAVSPNGRFIASGGSECLIRIWDTQEGKELTVLLGHRSAIKALAFSPDSLTLGSGDQGAMHHRWDMEKRGELASIDTFQWSGHEIHDIAFCPTLPLLASTGADGRIKLFDIGNANRKLEDMMGHSNKHVNALAFSPNGEYLASAGSDLTIRLWKVKNPHYVA